jgi:hypothetical protein
MDTQLGGGENNTNQESSAIPEKEWTVHRALQVPGVFETVASCASPFL